MSLKQVAQRFEDEGNVFSMYESCFPIVKSFFGKLLARMQAEEYKFTNIEVFVLPEDPTDLHKILLSIFIIAVQHMILTKKCDLDCLDDKTWDYLRAQLRNKGLIYR